jgi:hypothetical protein
MVILSIQEEDGTRSVMNVESPKRVRDWLASIELARGAGISRA